MVRYQLNRLGIASEALRALTGTEFNVELAQLRRRRPSGESYRREDNRLPSEEACCQIDRQCQNCGIEKK